MSDGLANQEAVSDDLANQQPVSDDLAPTDEEVAAAIAAITVLLRSAAAPAVAPRPPTWVRAARLQARRQGLTRGSWRLSGRIGRRSRA